LLMGLAQGAEGDVAAYAAARHFPISIFASAMGPVNAATALGAALGGVVLVPMLARWDNYVPFLIFSAIVTILGGIALFMMGRYPMLPEELVIVHD
jgi:MFS family permease